MNRKLTLLLVATTLGLIVSACRKETLGNKIDDAMDTRPAEKLQDKAEDLKDKVKDATN